MDSGQPLRVDCGRKKIPDPIRTRQNPRYHLVTDRLEVCDSRAANAAFPTEQLAVQIFMCLLSVTKHAQAPQVRLEKNYRMRQWK